MWIVRTVDQKRAAKSAAIKSYKWMSYIPSQNLQIAANLASLDVGDQMFETNFLDSCHNLQMLTIHWPLVSDQDMDVHANQKIWT